MANIRTVATMAAGPFGVLSVAAVPGNGVQLVALAGAGAGGSAAPYGSAPSGYAVTTGLNVAGMIAVAAAVGTYLGGLSAAAIAQLPNAQNGCPYVLISPGEVNVPCHAADIVSFGGTLQGVLNTAGNYGRVGS